MAELMTEREVMDYVAPRTARTRTYNQVYRVFADVLSRLPLKAAPEPDPDDDTICWGCGLHPFRCECSGSRWRVPTRDASGIKEALRLAVAAEARSVAATPPAAPCLSKTLNPASPSASIPASPSASIPASPSRFGHD
jgi:hypothetical protein